MTEPLGPLAGAARRFTAFAERWMPDAFVFALVATAIVFAAGLSVGAAPSALVDAWGKGFWELLSFTMQMALVIITGSVVASAPPCARFIGWLAARPQSPRGAVAMVAIFAMLSSWLNWGFSLVFSAVLAREVARRVRGADYRALAASSLLGLGSIWAQGLSGSAALQMATPGALQPAIRKIVEGPGLVPGGIVSLEHTIFLWQSLVGVAVEVAIVAIVMWFAVPRGPGVTARELGIDLGEARPPEPEPPPRPGERIERSPILTALAVALGGAFLVRTFASGGGLAAITLNTVNLFFLLVGFALHGTPARLARAVAGAAPAVAAVILQFPFYAGIAGMITYTHLNERIAHLFVQVSTPATFPAVVAIYSAVLGIFVPSGGSKWVIEAPYVMQAAHELRVHLGWTVAVYDLGEALANLLQPFWMVPVLGMLGLRARDVMGYTFLVFLALVPVVLLQVTLFGMTLRYPL